MPGDLAAQLCLRDAWPAPETADLDGWQLRAGKGGYNRINSVWPGRFIGADLAAAIEAAEAFYRARGLTPRFQILSIAEPADLDGELHRRGYVRDVDCSDMTKPVAAREMPPDVEAGAEADGDWLATYGGEQSPARHAELPMIVTKLAPRRAHLLCRRGSEPAGVALVSRIGDDFAVDCVVTRPAYRRTGVARALLFGAEAWAANAGAKRMLLSVVDDNGPAVSLYRGLGYARLAGYHYRVAAD